MSQIMEEFGALLAESVGGAVVLGVTGTIFTVLLQVCGKLILSFL